MNPAPETVSAADIAPATLPIPTSPAPASTGAGAPVSGPSAQENGPGDTSPTPGAPVDSKGVPFDPARHHAKTHPKTGRWLPKGGRKPKAAPGATIGGTGGATPPPSFIPPAPEAPKPEGAKPAPGAPPAPEGVDCSEDAGETWAHALQYVAGLIFDAPADAACTAPEHKRLSDTFAAFIRSKGWRAAAGVAAFVTVLAYAVRLVRKDKPAAKVREWIHGAPPPVRNVTPPDKMPKPAPEKPAGSVDQAPAQPAPPSAARHVFDLVPSDSPIQ